MGNTVRIAKVMLHYWEEPCISGDFESSLSSCQASVKKQGAKIGSAQDEAPKRGSGAIFFSGCSLRCVYCQNRDISRGDCGEEYSSAKLSKEFLRLQDMGAYNINLVTPTHYAEQIREAIDLVRGELKIPVVYNTSGYELDSEIEKNAGVRGCFSHRYEIFLRGNFTKLFKRT